MQSQITTAPNALGASGASKTAISNLRAIALAAREKAGKVEERPRVDEDKTKQENARKMKLVQEAHDYIVETTRRVAAEAAERGHGYTRIPTPSGAGAQNLVFRLPGTLKEKTPDGQDVLVQQNPEEQVYWAGKDGNPRENGLPWVGILQGFLNKQGKPDPASVPGGKTVIELAVKTLEEDGVRIHVAFNGKDRGLVLTAIWEDESWEKRQESIRRKHEDRKHEDYRPRQDRQQRPDTRPRLGDYVRK